MGLLKSSWQCEKCNGRVSKTEKCEECGSECTERTSAGERVYRADIPEHLKKDLVDIDRKSNALMNDYVNMTHSYFELQKTINENVAKRQQLQTKFTNTIEHTKRKMRLLKDKLINWGGYDPMKKQFVGLERKKKVEVADAKTTNLPVSVPKEE